ncbi:alginate lyase-domain-containing protein [Pterulicium gracile]|uniref:Alginate lyase-domain-containing protein n=1 Tax=Pterulicium gracile TaxID=1884261 RepID=A0A5C3QLR7_9AGAR|nr:alginate lyase-domain-containing protein [Pterula gracilis]
MLAAVDTAFNDNASISLGRHSTSLAPSLCPALYAKKSRRRTKYLAWQALGWSLIFKPLSGYWAQILEAKGGGNNALGLLFVNQEYARNSSAEGAHDIIITWAARSAANGPWSVVNKPATPPTGDKRDFMSWAPYWHPDCSETGNTTELPLEQVYSDCHLRPPGWGVQSRLPRCHRLHQPPEHVRRDLYNTLAFVITDNATYADTVVNFIDMWFLSPETGMKPNLDFAQMIRGVGRSKGSPTGVLDLKAMTKIASAVIVLCQMSAPQWTTGRDNGLNDWPRQYINWLETAELAVVERGAPNNHGTFYFNQLGAIQLMVSDFEGAKDTIMDFLNGIYQGQIVSS